MRLPVFERVARVALWGGFRLGAGWYPRLERFFCQKDYLESPFSETGTSDSFTPCIL